VLLKWVPAKLQVSPNEGDEGLVGFHSLPELCWGRPQEPLKGLRKAGHQLLAFGALCVVLWEIGAEFDPLRSIRNSKKSDWTCRSGRTRMLQS
jgi:hypothetical protein